MKTALRRSLVFVSLLAIGLGLTARAISSEENPHIVIASSTFDSATAGYYAYMSGMFKKAGINATFTPMKPSAIPPAIVGGSVQIAGNNLFSLVPGHERGVPLTIIAPGAVFDKTDENGYVGLVVKKSSTLKTGEDFTGKTVGVNDLKGFDAMAVMSWIDKTGGDSSKVNFVEMPAPSAGPAVAAGRIDATILTIPYLSEMLKTGEVKVLTDAYSAIAPSYLGLAWVTTTAFADAHPDLIARFGRVIHDANLYVNGHHEATVQMMADLAKVDPSRVRGVTRVSFAPYVTPELVQPVIDLLAKYKVISKPFPASEMISPYALKPGEK